MDNPAPKRRRPAVACIDCRRRKVKCDRSLPCSQCTQASLACAYRCPPASVNAQPNQRPSSPILQWPLANTNTDRVSAPNSNLLLSSDLASLWGPPSSTLDQLVDLQPSTTAQHAATMSPNNGSDPLPVFGSSSLQASTSSSPLESLGSTRHSVSKMSGLEHNKSYIQTALAGVEFLFHGTVPTLSGDYAEIVPLITKCRQFSKAIKARRSTERTHGSAGAPLPHEMPPKAICDRLIYLYIHTFESVFRILHVPSFQQEYQTYWNNPFDSSEVFLQKLLLVMAIGTCFYEERETHTKAHTLRSLASKWVYRSQEWLCHKFEISEVNLNVLQVSCLLSLARQTGVEASELVWISAEFPLRIAISLRLHQDPHDNFPEMPVFEAEMRKRLWATVLEISIQLSLDSGMPAPISSGDFDCPPPSNLDDSQIGRQADDCVSINPQEGFTQTTIQIMLMKSVHIRLKIVRLINAFIPSQNYQETLQLGSELAAAIRSHAATIQSYISIPLIDTARPTDFQLQVFHILTRRFLLALHAPFAAKVKSDPSFYFSRKCVTEMALVLLSNTRSSGASQEEPHEVSHSKVLSCGVFRHMLWQATVTLCVELVNDLLEDSFPIIDSLSRNKFQEIIRLSSEILVRRMQAGDTNVEAYVLCSCALAQAEAIQEGKAMGNHIVEAAKSSLSICCKILETHAGYSVQHSNSPPTDYRDTGLQSDIDVFAEWDFSVARP